MFFIVHTFFWSCLLNSRRRSLLIANLCVLLACVLLACVAALVFFRHWRSENTCQIVAFSGEAFSIHLRFLLRSIALPPADKVLRVISYNPDITPAHTRVKTLVRRQGQPHAYCFVWGYTQYDRSESMLLQYFCAIVPDIESFSWKGEYLRGSSLILLTRLLDVLLNKSWQMTLIYIFVNKNVD